MAAVSIRQEIDCILLHPPHPTDYRGARLPGSYCRPITVGACLQS